MEEPRLVITTHRNIQRAKNVTSPSKVRNIIPTKSEKSIIVSAVLLHPTKGSDKDERNKYT